MNDIKRAVEYFNNEEFEKSEQTALDILKVSSCNAEAIDVIAAVYLRTNKSILLETATKKELDYLRMTAVYLNKLKMYPHAIDFYEKILSIDSKDYIGFNNLGLLYEDIQEDEKAKNYYEKSLKIRPNFEAYYNLGICYRKQKDTKNAIKYVRQALQLKPDDIQTSYSLGMLYFMESNFYEGYKYFLRRKTKGIESLKNYWDGTPHPDKTVLVYCDYGFGDALMYSRYFPFLKKYFKNVKVCCYKNLKSIFENSFDEIEFTSELSLINYDYCVLAMNLPYYLKMDFSQIPFSNGYLKADEFKIKEFKEKYFNTDKLKVGLFWVGGDKEKRNAKNRMIPLYELQKVVNNEKAQFYSFQVEDPFDELRDFPNIINLGKHFNDFSDTAAAMKNLDLMISVDSAVIHLAGGLGIKSFLMLPKCSEWRWFLDEKKTVWYDSVELFVQNKLYDWSNVVDEIEKKLNLI